MGDVLLLPRGLEFQVPAQLRVKLTPPNTTADDLAVTSLSRLNPSLELGSELSYFEVINDFSVDPATQTLTIPVHHFSLKSWVKYPPVFLVYEFQGGSGKFYEKGDLLFALTNATQGQFGKWFPGHTGLYLGTEFPNLDQNDGSTIMDSSYKGANPLKVVLGDGVDFKSLFTFRRGEGHIFMGARRPIGFTPTKEERKAIARWAVNAKGRPYSVIGGGPFVSGFGEILSQNPGRSELGEDFGSVLASGEEFPDRSQLSCAGFTEGSYEEGIGKEIVPEKSLMSIMTALNISKMMRPIR